MRKILFYSVLVMAVTIMFNWGNAQAGQGNNGLSGPHWQFNIIGHPKNTDAISGDNSNGRAIMVPLKNANKADLVCPTDKDANFTDDTEPTFTDQEPAGAKIYFEASDHFEIIDRDATDTDGAKILIPSTDGNNPLHDQYECENTCPTLTGKAQQLCEDMYCPEFQKVIAVDVWVRVLGKPSTCMNINGYAYDGNQELYFWAGRIELARKTGKATWIPVSDIFTVHWCVVDQGECVSGTEELVSVFNNVFESYFWDILNDGTRLVQVRLYPVTE